MTTYVYMYIYNSIYVYMELVESRARAGPRFRARVARSVPRGWPDVGPKRSRGLGFRLGTAPAQ